MSTEDRIIRVKKSLVASLSRLIEDVVLLTISKSYFFSDDPNELKNRFSGSIYDFVDNVDELVKLRIKQSREDD